MTVWIVLKDGMVAEVFDKEILAIRYYNTLTKGFKPKIIKKEVKTF